MGSGVEFHTCLTFFVAYRRVLKGVVSVAMLVLVGGDAGGEPGGVRRRTMMAAVEVVMKDVVCEGLCFERS